MDLVRRVLPRGPADFAGQLLRAAALANGMYIVDVERHLSRPIVEPRVQHFFASAHWLGTAAAWTYWNAEFAGIALALLTLGALELACRR